MPRYPWRLLLQLGAHIEHGQYQEAHLALDRALDIITAARSGRLPLRKMRCAQVAGVCLRGAHRGGAPSSVILDEHLESLEELASQRSWKLVVELMHAYIDRLIGRVQPKQHTNMQRLVAWIREDIRSSLDAPRSLAQYAQTAGVSVGHLSRCFTTIVGYSFREERRRVRVEEAKRMLIYTSLKIGTITRRLGLCDPSQFVLDFRREAGMTPGAFRSMHQRCPP